MGIWGRDKLPATLTNLPTEFYTRQVRESSARQENAFHDGKDKYFAYNYEIIDLDSTDWFPSAAHA